MDDDKDARGDEPDKDPGAEGDELPEDAGTEPTGACASCGMANDDNAKFCDQCGSSMAAPPLDDDPPSSKKPGATVTATIVAPKPMSMEASVAGILGASSDSVPAVKTAAIELRRIKDTCAAVFGTTNAGEIVGALCSIPEQLTAAKLAVTENAQRAAAAAKSERWGLAKRLNALGLEGRPRSSIYVDKVDAAGKRVGLSLQPEYAKMDLDVFRGLVATLERSANPKKRTPFEANKAAAEAKSREASGQLPSGEPTQAQIDVAKSWPAVQRMFAAPGNTKSLDDIAKGALKNAAQMGGVQ